VNLENLSQKLQVAIIDDSIFSVKLLTELVRQFSDKVDLAFISTDSLEAIENLKKQPVDIVFLDIEMPEYNGFEILERVGEYTFNVVFTTAHENYALKAFKINAFDYLMKPVMAEQMKKVIDRFIEKNRTVIAKPKLLTAKEQQQEEKIIEAKGNLIIDTHGKTYFLNISKIIYLKAERVYSSINYEGKNIIVSKSTNYFEPILENMNFFRIHRSYLINLNHVKEVVKKEGSAVVVRMNNNDELSLSRQNKEAFFSRMKTLTQN
jgi:two-component system LytT family response regulator